MSGKRGTTLAAEFLSRLVLGAARSTYCLQRRPALRAELPPFPIIGPAFRTAHALRDILEPSIPTAETSEHERFGFTLMAAFRTS